MKFEWECIRIRESESMISGMERAKIHGGWLVLNRTSIIAQGNYHVSESMVFVQDPDHNWEIENENL